MRAKFCPFVRHVTIHYLIRLDLLALCFTVQVKERVVRVDGHNVMAWTLNSGTCAPVSAPKAHKSVMLHRRKCQRCGRSVGEFLMCAKCPMVMHKFCVKAEAWGVYTHSQMSSIIKTLCSKLYRALTFENFL